MASIRALKKRILKQIEALQKQLEAVELVEQLASQAGEVTDGIDDDTDGAGVTSIQQTAASVLADEWQSVQQYHELVRKVHPGATLTAVSTAMRRLTGKGDAERRGSKKEGLEYRRTKKEAPQQQP